MNQELQGTIRHVLTTLGGMIASKGLIESADVDIVVGAIVALIGFAWSIYSKRKGAK